MRSSCTLIEDDGLWFEGTDGSHLFVSVRLNGLGKAAGLERRNVGTHFEEISRQVPKVGTLFASPLGTILHARDFSLGIELAKNAI